MGTAVVVLKLGDQGLYLRTTDDPNRLATVPSLASPWLPRGRGKPRHPATTQTASVPRSRGCREDAATHGTNRKAKENAAWLGRELLSPCFQVDVVGTTGSGDATIAGFLSAITKGLSPEDAVTAATAVGACCCEAADSTSGVRPWDEVQKRIHGGWKRREVRMKLDGWRLDRASGLWLVARDSLRTFG
jgi:hypothetical protein